MDDMFSRMQKAAAAELFEKSQLSFQERCVRMILKFAAFPESFVTLKARAKEHYGRSDLSFAWFAEEFPAYPVNLMSQRLRYTAKPRWTELFGAGFAKQTWFKEYHKQVAEYAWDLQTSRCAMFFNAPHADTAATMVLHNQPVANMIIQDAELRGEPETRILRPYGRPQVTYVIESAKSFMCTVGTDWANF